jgi:hypothetical protein
MTLKGIIKSIPVTGIRNGMQVIANKRIYRIVGKAKEPLYVIGKREGNTTGLRLSSVKKLVVEFPAKTLDPVKETQIPLRYIDWQKVIAGNLVDRNALIEFEILRRNFMIGETLLIASLGNARFGVMQQHKERTEYVYNN